MSYNDGAQIVPISESQKLLRALAPNADISDLNDSYDRMQRLTERAARYLVSAAWDPSAFKYGEDSPDFPLCYDFVTACLGDILKFAAGIGMAVRPEVFGLNYTRTDGKRHAIICFVLADRAPIFVDPQSCFWSDQPDFCRSMDRFRV